MTPRSGGAAWLSVAVAGWARAVAGWAVAVQGAAVRAGGGGGAVGVQGQGPAPAVDDDLVVERAQGDQVPQGGRAGLGAGDQVVDVADAGGLIAAGEGAVAVPDDDRAAQVDRDGLAGRADVQRQADRGQRAVVEPGAQPGGQPA